MRFEAVSPEPEGGGGDGAKTRASLLEDGKQLHRSHSVQIPLRDRREPQTALSAPRPVNPTLRRRRPPRSPQLEAGLQDSARARSRGRPESARPVRAPRPQGAER